jgi:GT2 family glycosyltransferase
MPQALPSISVIIVNYNRRDDIRQALESVLAQDYPPQEIIVVDNASSDDSLAMIKREFPSVICIELTKNIGMDGYSVGCRAARSEIIFQMDNDSQMPETTVLRQVAEAFQSGPSDMAILATYVAEYREGKNTIAELRTRETRQGLIKSFGYHAGGVAFRKAYMDQVGYYNEDVFLYGAELFVQLQAIAGGYSVYYAPKIYMLHKASGVARSTRGVYYEVRNRYWCIRHFGSISQCIRYFPFLMLHDIAYSVHRRAIGVGFRGIRDGIAKLPLSLPKPLTKNEKELRNAVRALGRSFSPMTIARRIVSRVTRKKT